MHHNNNHHHCCHLYHYHCCIIIIIFIIMLSHHHCHCLHCCHHLHDETFTTSMCFSISVNICYTDLDQVKRSSFASHNVQMLHVQSHMQYRHPNCIQFPFKVYHAFSQKTNGGQHGPMLAGT